MDNRNDSAGGLLLQKDGRETQVLLVEHLDDTWVFPKGHIQAGETPAQAAQREIEEETGFRARVGEYLGPVVRGTKTASGEVGDQRTIHMFLAELSDRSTGQPAEESTAWFGYDEALAKLRYDADREFLANHRMLFM